MHANIRVPPDSTGTRVHGRAFIDISYTNLSGDIYLRDRVVFGTSGIIGLLSDWTPATGTTGQMHVILAANSAETDLVPGETMTIGVATPTPASAIAAGGTPFFDNATVLSGKTVDSWLEVDSRGSASMRFTEGSPQMDGFGNLKTSQSSTVGEYVFSSFFGELFSDVVVGNGIVEHLPDTQSINLAVTSASGDYASRTSDKYHFYIPGTSTLFIMAVALSDDGRAGCERRWGAFDTRNGLYFDLDDLLELKVVVRGDTSGTVVKTHINREDWNGDKVDGTGLSKFVLDLSMLNTYWINLQWGVDIRFGIMDQLGNRIVCHTIAISNQVIKPLVREGTLPIGINIENKSATGGSSSIRLTSASVQTEGPLDYTFWRYIYDFPQVTPGGANELCVAIKSVPAFDGRHNSVSAYPEFLTLNVGGTGVVKVDIYWDYLTITGEDFTDLDANGSTVVGTYTGTISPAADAYRPGTWYLPVGTATLDLKTLFDKNDMGLCPRADETTGQYVAVVVSKISGSPTIVGAIGYAEVA